MNILTGNTNAFTFLSSFMTATEKLIDLSDSKSRLPSYSRCATLVTVFTAGWSAGRYSDLYCSVCCRRNDYRLSGSSKTSGEDRELRSRMVVFRDWQFCSSITCQ